MPVAKRVFDLVSAVLLMPLWVPILLLIGVLMAMVGLGLGFVMPLMSTLIQNSVEQHLMGVASSSRQFFMSIASVFGVAILYSPVITFLSPK